MSWMLLVLWWVHEKLVLWTLFDSVYSELLLAPDEPFSSWAWAWAIKKPHWYLVSEQYLFVTDNWIEYSPICSVPFLDWGIYICILHIISGNCDQASNIFYCLCLPGFGNMLSRKGIRSLMPLVAMVMIL